MAASLVRLYKRVDGDTTKYVYVYGRDLLVGTIGGAFAKLRWWGLVKRATKHKRDRALWRITERGAAFVRDELYVSRYIVVQRDVSRPLEFSEELIDIRGALRKRFDYDELFTA